MEHPVYQMTSFSRSGETLLQRCLDAHPKIRAVHQIAKVDTERDLSLFEHLRTSGATTLRSGHAAISHWDIAPGTAVLMKNATFIDKHERRGFILIRNPFSVVFSAHRYRQDEEQWKRNRLQQVRWCKTIDKAMLPYIQTGEILDTFLALYTAKMMHDFNSGLPIVRYEDFILNPEAELRKVVGHFGLEWDDMVIRSHEKYSEGEFGHGNIKLWQPIHNKSMDKYNELDARMLSRIYSLTRPVLDAYGYGWDGKKIDLGAIDQRF
ncbi:sulfotransferase [Agrobacterium sp. a22-2]|uniref:sulfotransferase family protein n=1 Tax=Agrobacterium sp. a22-2 TaxID=2283840 RepID=UPI001447BF5C|nr:sulfotransferase [Agrobacterium sp. a22-2]NKN36328.1 sulfotransferase [Agrobacterium sp. a22-2]